MITLNEELGVKKLLVDLEDLFYSLVVDLIKAFKSSSDNPLRYGNRHLSIPLKSNISDEVWSLEFEV